MAAAPKWTPPPAPPAMMNYKVDSASDLISSMKTMTHNGTVPVIILYHNAYSKTSLEDFKIVLIPQDQGQREVKLPCFVVASICIEKKIARVWGAIPKEKILKCKLDDKRTHFMCFPNMFTPTVPTYFIPPPPPPTPIRLMSAAAPPPPLPSSYVWQVYHKPPTGDASLSIITEAVEQRIEWYHFISEIKAAAKESKEWWKTDKKIPDSIWLRKPKQQRLDQISYFMFNLAVQATCIVTPDVAKNLQQKEFDLYTFRIKVIQPHCMESMEWIECAFMRMTGKSPNGILKLHASGGLELKSHLEWTGNPREKVWELPFEWASWYVGKRRVVLDAGRAFLTPYQLAGMIQHLYKKTFLKDTREYNLRHRLSAHSDLPVNTREIIRMCYSELKSVGNSISVAKFDVVTRNSVRVLKDLDFAMPACVRNLNIKIGTSPNDDRWIARNWMRKMGATESAVRNDWIPKYTNGCRVRGIGDIPGKIKIFNAEIHIGFGHSKSSSSAPPYCMNMLRRKLCPYAIEQTAKGAHQAFSKCTSDLNTRRGKEHTPVVIGEHSSPLAFGLELVRIHVLARAKAAAAKASDKSQPV